MITFSHLWQYLATLFLEWEIVRQNSRENQNTGFMFSNFFPENHAVYEVMSKNMVEPEGPQMTSQYGAYALHSG